MTSESNVSVTAREALTGRYGTAPASVLPSRRGMAGALSRPLKPTGFWSYSTSDDAHSGGRLSQLRLVLADALQQQIGREPRVQLFQDLATIPLCADWERQIHDALANASFFIPIITPGFLQSEWCGREVLRFAARQKDLGRNDLIFPIYQIDVEDFSGVRQSEMHDPEVLTLLRKHQWTDFRELEFLAVDSAAVRQQMRRLAQAVRAALYREVTETPAAAGTAPPPPPASSSPPPRAATNAVSHTPEPARTVPPARTRRVRVRTLAMGLTAGVATVIAGVIVYHNSGPGLPSSPNPPAAPAIQGPAKPISRSAVFTSPAPAPPAHPADPVLALAPAVPPDTQPVHSAPGFDNGTRDCDLLCPRLVLIQSGEFVMGISDAESRREGSEAADGRARPPHSVTIGRAFYLSEAPITRGEYGECVTARKCKEPDAPSFAYGNNDPVVNVSYDDAIAYAGWLTATTGNDYRLPSEAEWEYAARAGTRTARYWGDDYDDRHGDTVPRTRQATMQVKSFPPNKFGLYDMLGNVWQWTEDCWNDDYRGNVPQDEHPRSSGGCWARVLRGGSWYSNSKYVRAGVRDRYNAGYRYAYTGFRVARNL